MSSAHRRLLLFSMNRKIGCEAEEDRFWFIHFNEATTMRGGMAQRQYECSSSRRPRFKSRQRFQGGQLWIQHLTLGCCVFSKLTPKRIWWWYFMEKKLVEIGIRTHNPAAWNSQIFPMEPNLTHWWIDRQWWIQFFTINLQSTIRIDWMSFPSL